MEHKFQVGDRVRVIESTAPLIAKVGDLGVVLSCNGEFTRVKLDNYPNNVNWYTRKFELVVPDAPMFKVGDKVRVVKKEKGGGLIWPEQMDQYVNNGEVYTIEEGPHENGAFLLSCHWNFLPDSLELVVADAKPAKKKAAKAKPKKPRKPKKLPNKSLRSHLRMEMAKRYPAGKPTGLCSYAAKMEDNAIITQIGQLCHASIGYAFPYDRKVKELAYSLHHEVKRFNVDATKESFNAYKKYVHYILNDSPWAPCFLTKNVPVALRYDVLMDVSRSRHEIAGACIALREGTEYPDKRYIFEKVLNKGYKGHTAFLMSYVFGKDKEHYDALNLDRGHCVLGGFLALDDLVKFFKEGYSLTKKDKPYSEDHCGYEVIRMIGGVRGHKPNFQDFVGPLIEKKQVGDGWNAKYYVLEETFFKVADAIENLFKEQA